MSFSRGTSLMSHISVSSVASASSRTRNKNLLNSYLELLKVFLLVMRTNPTPIDTTTSPPGILKYLVTWTSMRIMAPKKSKFFQVM
jgi:hypothetical protein